MKLQIGVGTAYLRTLDRQRPVSVVDQNRMHRCDFKVLVTKREHRQLRMHLKLRFVLQGSSQARMQLGLSGHVTRLWQV